MIETTQTGSFFEATASGSVSTEDAQYLEQIPLTAMSLYGAKSKPLSWPSPCTFKCLKCLHLFHVAIGLEHILCRPTIAQLAEIGWMGASQCVDSATEFLGTSLRRIAVHECNLPDSICDWLADQRELEELSTRATNIDDQVLLNLSCAATLKKLALVSSDVALATSNMPLFVELRYLDVSSTSVTDTSIDVIFNCFPNLKHLNISNTEVSKRAAAAIFARFQGGLQSFDTDHAELRAGGGGWIEL